MLDKDRVFGAALHEVGLGQRVGGCGIDSLKSAFLLMKSSLDALASTDESDAFKTAIERAINEAASFERPELTTEGRDAVLDALQSAFDGMPRRTNVQAVECNFLSRVRF